MTPSTFTPPKAAPEVIDPDKAWRETLPVALQGVAERHGKAAYQWVFMTGLANESLGVLAQKLGTIAEAMEMLSRVATAMNHFAGVSRPEGLSDGQFLTIKLDIERAIQLTQATPTQSRSGIILPQ